MREPIKTWISLSVGLFLALFILSWTWLIPVIDPGTIDVRPQTQAYHPCGAMQRGGEHFLTYSVLSPLHCSMLFNDYGNGEVIVTLFYDNPLDIPSWNDVAFMLMAKDVAKTEEHLIAIHDQQRETELSVLLLNFEVNRWIKIYGNSQRRPGTSD